MELTSYPYKAILSAPKPYPYAWEPSLMYVRVRCPVCGMLVRLDNLDRDHVLNEEMADYSGGRAKIFHKRKINSTLKEFWIKRLLYVLKRLGWTMEIEVPYSFQEAQKEVKVRYVYQRRQSEGYPYTI